MRVLDARDPIPRTAEDVAVEALGVRQAVDARELDGVAKAEPSPRPRRRRARAKGAR